MPKPKYIRPIAGNDYGVLHRHADGTEHRHFSDGFEIGGQLIMDNDGTEEHSHGTLSLVGGPSNPNTSGSVVWFDTEERENKAIMRDIVRGGVPPWSIRYQS